MARPCRSCAVPARSCDLLRSYDDPAFGAALNQQDVSRRGTAPLRQRCAGVPGGDAFLAVVGRDVFVAHGYVVPAGRTNLRSKNRRRTFGLLEVFVEESMRHGHVPASVVSRRDVGQGMKSGFVGIHTPPPDNQVEFRKRNGLAVQLRNDAHVVARSTEIVALVNAVGMQAVMIARQNDGGAVQATQLVLRKGDGVVGNAVMIEEVAGDEDDVDSRIEGVVDDGLEAAMGAGRLRRPLRPVVEVHVRRV